MSRRYTEAMKDILRRLSWFFVVSVFLAYGAFLFAGSTIQTNAYDTAHIVQVRDLIAPGVHHLTGMVMVPETCSEISVTNEKISESTYKLVFRTWNEPAVKCIKDETPRVFRSVVFAPGAGVHFIGTLDGEPLTIVVYQEKAR